MLSTSTMSVRASAIIPVHEVRDEDKFDALRASMELVGWDGRPLLVVAEGRGLVALTGSHRWAAANAAGIEIPCMVIDTDDYEGDEAAFEAIQAASDDDDRLACLSECGLDDAATLMAAELE